MDVGLSTSTVKQARDRFSHLFFPGDTQGVKFLDRVTEAIERLHGDERWIGSLATFSINVATDKTFCLPYYLESIHAARVGSHPARVKGQTFEFLYNGPGEVAADTGVAGTILDMGVMGIQRPFPDTPSTLQFEAVTGADVGKKVRVLGYNAAGKWITESDGTPGEEVTLAGTNVVTANTYSGVKGIQKPVTAGRVVVNHVADAVELAEIEGAYTNTFYHCYRVLDTAAETVTALCKRRPIPVRHDEDYIFPGNLAALKLMFQALKFEEVAEFDRAQQHFRMAREILNAESATFKGSAEESLNFEPWGPGVTGIGSTY